MRISWTVVVTALVLYLSVGGFGQEALNALPQHRRRRARFDPRNSTRPKSKTEEINEMDLAAIQGLKPLKEGSNIMFWRPQKVGSSTIVSLLMSYAYRYNFLPQRREGSNVMCLKFAQCAKAMVATPGTPDYEKSLQRLRSYYRNGLDVKISLAHEVCNRDMEMMKNALACGFSTNATVMTASPERIIHQVKELFLVREPVERAISVYYFWGELYKMRSSPAPKPRRNETATPQKKAVTRQSRNVRMLQHNLPKSRLQFVSSSRHKNETASRRALQSRLGSSSERSVWTGVFRYHGAEHTAPPVDVAIAYAKRPPYTVSNPGPSSLWSFFANNAGKAVEALRDESRLIPLVLERLDESLVVMAHFLDWSLADVVVTKIRKALSPHPKAQHWPAEAIEKLKDVSTRNGEGIVYNETVANLNRRLAKLKQQGVDVAERIKKLSELRERASSLCFDTGYLENYRSDISSRGIPAVGVDTLREVEDVLHDGGHLFSFNKYILGSFDVCGSCESHAALLAVAKGLSTSLTAAPKLADLDKSLIQGNVNFAKCPEKFPHVAHKKGLLGA